MFKKEENSNGVNLSIIIVNWNTKNLLEKCLASVYENYQNLNIEVFVVDNASNDKSVEMVREKFPYTKLIINKKNVGFARANNQAIKQAKGGFVVFLNSDTEILDGALEKMVNFMKNHQDCGVAGCRILNPDHSLQLSVRRFPTLWSQIIILTKLHNFFPKLVSHYLALDFNYSKTQEVDQVMGAFFIVRKNLFDEIDLLDENFYIWFEEVDFCKRVKNYGKKVFYTPEAEIIHYGGQSFKQMMSLEKQRTFNKSLRYYFKKYHSFITYLILLIFNPISLLLAYLIQIIDKKDV